MTTAFSKSGQVAAMMKNHDKHTKT